MASRIGFNPQDRFMVSAGDAPGGFTLVVITNRGDVFGAPILQTLQPVFQFSGAKIGFNTQDRFMVALSGPVPPGGINNNTLVVITDDGSVFGADVDLGASNIQPVVQFSGARIGFNPQDRFMVALGDTLLVITDDGSVFGARVVNRVVQPVFQFSGAKIGFNTQDRFMVALGSSATSVNNTLVVITNDGSVFGADVVGENIQPVFQFSGAKIGFNTQDRFMVGISDQFARPPGGNSLDVITADGNVFEAGVVNRNILPVRQVNT